MTFKVQCHQCSKHLKVPEKVLGKILKCPRCGAVVVDAAGQPTALNPDMPAQPTEFNPEDPLELGDDVMFPVDTVPARPAPRGLRAVWRMVTANAPRALGLEKLAEQHGGALRIFGRQFMVALVATLAVWIFQGGSTVGKLCGLMGFVLAAHGFRLRLRPTDDAVENAIETYAAPAIGYAAMAAALLATIRWFFVILKGQSDGSAAEPLVWLCVYAGLFAVVVFTFMGAAQQFGFFRSASWIYLFVIGAIPFVLWVINVPISDAMTRVKGIVMIANEKIQVPAAKGSESLETPDLPGPESYEIPPVAP